MKNDENQHGCAGTSEISISKHLYSNLKLLRECYSSYILW